MLFSTRPSPHKTNRESSVDVNDFIITLSFKQAIRRKKNHDQRLGKSKKFVITSKFVNKEFVMQGSKVKKKKKKRICCIIYNT